MKTIFTILTLLLLSMNVLADEVVVEINSNERHVIIYKEICLGGRLFVTAISPEGTTNIRSVALVQVRDGTSGGYQVQCYNKAKKQ